jgi:8-oxo-dGTP pyrophosphatase MutT (NUDIX family)
MQITETATAEARRASTVVVARDAAATRGVEVVLIQRHAGLRFMGGTYVFPGGAVQPNDWENGVANQMAVAPCAWSHSSEPALDRAHAIAAVRETFEEVGLLLGAPALESAQLRALRVQALDGADFGALLASAQLELDLGRLIPLIRWVTPGSEPIRFDTRFYVAQAPERQIAEHDRQECVALQWLTPTAAIEQARTGALLLSPPTRRTLEEIEDTESVEALLSKALQSEAPTVEPVIQEIDGVRLLLFPGDPAHPVRARALDRGPTRMRL